MNPILIIIFKTLVLYGAVVVCIRTMGKRQIGELQPSELVITLLVSEIAAVPLQDENTPLENALIPLAVMLFFEFAVSVWSIKSVKFRNLVQGKSVIIIRDGTVDQEQLKKLRYTIEDVLEELRKNNIWSIDDVQYAFVETDGKITVLEKPEKRQVTAEQLGIPVRSDSVPVTVIDDGVIIKENLKECNITESKISTLLENRGLKIKDVLLLEMTKRGITALILKQKKRIQNG